MNRREMVRLLAFAIAGGGLAACGDGPPVLNYDRDSCEFCRMTLTDRRYGAALRMSGGRIHRFDTIDCLAGWLVAESGRQPGIIWVVDATEPGVLVPLDSVKLLARGSGGPMGAGYFAVNLNADPAEWGGVPASWDEVQKAAAEAR